MKKWAVFVVALACIAALAACGQHPQEEEPNGQDYFNAAVLEVHEDYILAECLDVTSGVVSAGTQAKVSTDVVSAKGLPEIAAGDHIRVVFGAINDTIPLEVGNVFAIYLLDENGEVLDPS